MSYYYRKGVNPGISKVRPWLEKWIDDSSDILISNISIDLPKLIYDEVVNKKSYQDSLHGNQTPLHAYLKYQLYNWLSLHTGKTPTYEQKSYHPDEEMVEKFYDPNMTVISIDGTEISDTFDPTIPRLVKKGEAIYQHCGLDIFMDVYCDRMSIEVGYTQPLNILLPILDGVVSTSFWFPFPKGVIARQFEPFGTSLNNIEGYQFKLRTEA